MSSADTGGAGIPLWQGDTGSLHESSRRVLLELLKGPYLSGARHPQLWAALLADEGAIRSRLHDLFLELALDPVDEFAFLRKVRTTERAVPAALRTERLTFLDTVMLLVLRQLLLASPGDQQVIVDQDEVYERLAIYRTGDEVTFTGNLNSAWKHMRDRFRVIHMVGERRAAISPLVKSLIDDERVRTLTEVYQRLAGQNDGDRTPRSGTEPEIPGTAPAKGPSRKGNA